MPNFIKKIEKSSFVDALKELGVQKGDNLFIHSDLLRLGYPLRLEYVFKFPI